MKNFKKPVFASLSLAAVVGLGAVGVNSFAGEETAPRQVVSSEAVNVTDSVNFVQEEARMLAELHEKREGEILAQQKAEEKRVAEQKEKDRKEAERKAEDQRVIAEQEALLLQQQATEAAAIAAVPEQPAVQEATVAPAPVQQAAAPAPVVEAPAPVPAASVAQHIQVGLAGGQEAIDLCQGPVLYTPLSSITTWIAEHDACGGWQRFGGLSAGMKVSIGGQVNGEYTVGQSIQVPRGSNTSVLSGFGGGVPSVVLQVCIPGTNNMILVGLY